MKEKKEIFFCYTLIKFYFSKQKDEFSRQIFDLKHQLENEKAAREEAEKTSSRKCKY